MRNPDRDSVWGQGAGSQVQGAQGLPPQRHTHLCKYQSQVSQVLSLLSITCALNTSYIFSGLKVLWFCGLYPFYLPFNDGLVSLKGELITSLMKQGNIFESAKLLMNK